MGLVRKKLSKKKFKIFMTALYYFRDYLNDNCNNETTSN
jgi:hypothetical protein